LGDGRWLLKIDGEWYEVQMATLPPEVIAERSALGDWPDKYRAGNVFDLVLGAKASRRDHHARNACDATHGAPVMYAVSKRQLSRREIVKYGLPR
jgi:hypothetical protein